MALFIKHRVNTIADLANVEPAWGVEIDVRSDVSKKGALHLNHDPWVRGDDFSSWLKAFKQKGITGPIIVNTKEDGLEETVFAALEQAGVKNFFFLDTAVPTLVKYTQAGHGDHFAIRLSSYEPENVFERFPDWKGWVWVDCFGAKPLPATLLQKNKNLKYCLVSPELQGAPLAKIAEFRDLAKLCQAICTKNPAEWLNADRPKQT